MVLYGNAWQGDYLRYGADFRHVLKVTASR